MSLPPIHPKVEELAERIADDALNSEDKDFRLDCFKVLSTFYIGTAKLSGKIPGEDEGESSVPAMRRRLRSVGGNDAG